MLARPESIAIRSGELSDLDRIDDLEQRAFTTPWTRDSLRAELLAGEGRVCEIAELAGRFAGYSMFWSVADELHLVTLAVEPEFRRNGVGSALLASMLGGALAGRSSLATLEVRAGNTAAIELYRRFGFREIALRQRYYPDNQEDALVMLRELRPGAL